MRISKAKMIFWRINLGLRLEDLINKHTDFLSKRNIKENSDVWMKLGNNPASLCDLALCLRDYKSYEKENLIRVFNPHLLEIQQMDLLIRHKKEEFKRFITKQPDDQSILATEKRYAQRRIMEDDLNALKLKRAVLPAVNSVPADFYAGVGESQLEQEGLIVKGYPYSELTDNGRAVIEEIYDLRDMVTNKIGRQHENADRVLIDTLWKSVKGAYLGKSKKTIWQRVMG